MREIRVGSIQPLEQPRLYASHGEVTGDMAREKIGENLALACRLLEQAGQRGCDIVAYPEDLQGIGHYLYYVDLGLFRSPPGS